MFSKTKVNNLDNSNIFTEIKITISPHTCNSLQDNVQVLQRPCSLSFCVCLCRALGLMAQMWPEPQKCCFRDWLFEPQTAGQNLKQIWSCSVLLWDGWDTTSPSSPPRLMWWRRIMFSNISEAQEFSGLFLLIIYFNTSLHPANGSILPIQKKATKNPQNLWILQVFNCPPYKSGRC